MADDFNYEELCEILLGAYKNYRAVRKLVRFKLGRNLQDIAPDTLPIGDVIFELVEWVDSNRERERLIKGAYALKPDNKQLEQYCKSQYPFFVLKKNNIIAEEKIEELLSIIRKIDFSVLREKFKNTVKKETKDIVGQIPEILELSNTNQIKNILLDKYPSRKEDKVPTILEFAQRLHDCDRVDRNTKSSLYQWLNRIINEKSIDYPIKYKKPRPKLQKKVDSYLFVIANEIEIGNKFNLSAELIPRYQSDEFERIPLELSKEQYKICQLEEITDVVGKFVECAKIKLRHEYGYIQHNLIIELFLPYKYLRETIDLQKILASGGRERPLGQQYYFAIRCSDRYLLNNFSNYGDFLSNLCQKWDVLQEIFETKFSQATVNTNLICAKCINQDQNWDYLRSEWDEANIVSVNLSCSLPNDGREQNFFLYLLIAGIPLSLWNRSSKLRHTEVESEFLLILNWAILNNSIELHQNIYTQRNNAHLQGDSAVEHLGYHLGFLLDNPYLVPTVFDLNNGGELLLSSE